MTKEKLDVRDVKEKYDGLKEHIGNEKDWAECWDASIALESAECEAIDNKYNPLIEDARERGDQLRQQITDLNKRYTDGSIPYGEMTQKYEEIRKKLDAVNDEFDNARKSRREALDKSHESFKKRMDELNQSPFRPSQTPTKSSTVVMQSSSMGKILEDYQTKFSNNSWYQANPPYQKDGKQFLPFANEKDMVGFYKDQAQKNRDMIIVDGATNKVMGYAKEGKLYHSDGNPFNDDDTFKPGEKTLDQFTMSSPTPSPMSMQPPNTSKSLTGSVEEAIDTLQKSKPTADTINQEKDNKAQESASPSNS